VIEANYAMKIKARIENELTGPQVGESPASSPNVKAAKLAAGLCGLVVWLAGTRECPAQPTLGIPEPGLVLYGSVTNAGGGLSVPVSTVTWQISGGTPADLVTVTSTVVVVNGQSFHVARVPFETRSVGNTNFGRTPNLLGLSKTPATYARAVCVNGTKGLGQ
jgi:hypothetical protein